MENIITRVIEGVSTATDLDVLRRVANNIEGNTIYELGDAAPWLVQSTLKDFREEFGK